MKKLPISIQTFEDVISHEMVYVDKTKYLLDLVSSGKYYFLSRPRRFGKSMLLTTLKAFFRGKKELFEGLFIYDKVNDWTPHPVVHIDYSLVDYKLSQDIFIESLLNHLTNIAAEYDIQLSQTIVSDAFVELVQKLYTKYKERVVVLVDEYDKAMVDVLTKPDRFEQNREILRTLYATMKGLDGMLRFVMLTGVSRFAKVGIFSGMNNLNDISMNSSYSTVVGFTQEELEQYFVPYLEVLGNRFAKPLSEILKYVQEWYNGFSFDGQHRLYNPFSILKLFTEYEFHNYWFSTGTPNFLMDLIVQQKHLPETFEGLKVTDLTGSSLKGKNFPLIPLLYQTGYLSIESKGFDELSPYYYLNYPNREVRDSFLRYIAAAFKDQDEFEIQPEALALRDALHQENIDRFVRHFQSFLSDIPARLHIPQEAYYHSLVYLMLRIVGAKLLLEKETDKGRIDAVLELPDKIYIIEFKFATGKRIKQVSTLSRQALKQIKTKQYYQPFRSANKPIFLMGLGFLNKQLHGRLEKLPADPG